MNPFLKLIPKPSPESVNTGMSPCPTGLLLSKYGPPRPLDRVTSNCQGASSKPWADRMVTEDVGPFKVTGHRMYVKTLRAAFADLKASHPDLYAQVGSAGCLCVRWVRGTNGSLSNHSYGLAIDLTIAGSLDIRGDDKIQTGLLTIYNVFKKHGIFWGVEFRTEDAMHFEASRELVLKWIQEGVF